MMFSIQSGFVDLRSHPVGTVLLNTCFQRLVCNDLKCKSFAHQWAFALVGSAQRMQCSEFDWVDR